jgi:hypothetical protein
LRRLIPLLAILLPSTLAAQPADRFCAGLRQLVAATQSSFEYLPQGVQLLPGSIAERRGITSSDGGPARAAIFAVMLRTPSRQRPNPVEARARALEAEISRCLPGAERREPLQQQNGAVLRWVTEWAVVSLRRDDGDGFASDAEVEVTVASRW